MNKKLHIYVILYFILIILVIDIYITYNLVENFNVLDISVKNLIYLIKLIINLPTLIPELNKKNILFIVNNLIIHYDNQISEYFLQIGDEQIEDEQSNLDNLSNQFINQNKKFKIFKQSITNLELLIKNDNEFIPVETQSEEDVESILFKSKVLLQSASKQVNLETESSLNNQKHIFNIFEKISITPSLCDKITYLTQFLILYYIEYIETSTNSVTKSKFLSLIDALSNTKLSCN